MPMFLVKIVEQSVTYYEVSARSVGEVHNQFHDGSGGLSDLEERSNWQELRMDLEDPEIAEVRQVQ